MSIDLESFKAMKHELEERRQAGKARRTVIVGMGTCGIAAGAQQVWAALRQELNNRGLPIALKKTGCIGICEREVLVDVVDEEGRWTYGDVTADKVPAIIESHLVNNRRVDEWLLGKVDSPECPYPDMGFYRKQVRRVLVRCGFIDPESIDDYLAWGGYSALVKVLESMTPEQVIEEIERSGLRGRGGAGFPTGLKWRLTRQAPGEIKYVVCNADEGDPGAFMDRSILEGDPHAVLEGMMIAGWAIGAQEGYIYVRAEYPLAIKRLRIAIQQARDYGLLGENVLGTGRRFELKIKEGAGAFVCGEETALLASIEGSRGMPRPRPPFPAQKGLWGRPTNINNVETYANVPAILLHGADWFASLGTERSKGTKVFALTGKVAHTGLVEVPMGMTLREIIFDVGGGIKGGKQFKGVQIGGPSGGCLPADKLDLPIDYDSLTAAGAMMGSGGLVVLDEETCMVDLARFFLNFTQSESCGKCTPCREGTKRMLETLERICEGEGDPDVLERLASLAQTVKDTSLCGLGQTAPNPVLTTIRYFREEYEAHLGEKRCPAKVCRALLEFRILRDACRGCGACKKVCPVEAITGERKEPHEINAALCTRCGACVEACPFDAIVR